MVFDIRSGSGSSSPSHLTVFNNKLYFGANDGTDGNELWQYDGSNDPSMVFDINTSGNSNPGYLTVFNNKLYFSAYDNTNRHEIWQYDGSNDPSMVFDINTSGSSTPEYLTVFNNKLYFRADDGTNSHEIWQYDGSSNPSMVFDINTSGNSAPRYLTVFNNKLYFRANDNTSGKELWQYDGSSNPSMVHDINSSGDSDSEYLTVFNNKLYFGANDGTDGSELWQYDGSNNPSMVFDIRSGSSSSYPSYLTVFNNKLYFQANDGTTNGAELWQYDGSNDPSMVFDINTSGSSYPGYLTVFNNKLYFTADDGTDGYELWVLEELPPTVPSNLTATATSPTLIDLAWTDNSDDETGFLIERDGSVINTTAVDAISYSDSSVSCGTTYNYFVKATNSGGDSTAITASATTEACPDNGGETSNPDNSSETSSSSGNATILPEELNVTIKFSGEGTVNLDRRVCKSENEECKYSLKVAKHYSLKATPAAGYEFDRWSGSSTCSDGDIFLIKNTVCKAVFKEKVSETNSDGNFSNTSGSNGNGVISDNFRPINISTRAKIMGGEGNAIAGFILQGSGQQTVMLQGHALEDQVDPVITVNKFPSGDLVATNDNWQDAENADKIPDNLKLTVDSDAGLLLDLAAGAYTINLGSNGDKGIAIVSVNLVADENGKYTNDLINLSTRASIQGGANDVIAGFIINGNDTRKVLILTRGLDEGVDTTLKLQKYPSGDTVAENDDWQNADNSGDITISLNDTDAALLLDLAAGAYTAVMSSNGEKGLGIVEVNIVQ